MSDLKPGDFCVIVDHSSWVSSPRECIGRLVILIELDPNCATHHRQLESDAWYVQWCPHWRVSGLDSQPSHKILRKIEPPALGEETEAQEELTA